MKRPFFYLILLILIQSCSKNQNVHSVVASVDIARYCGKWYEIASYPVSFQKGCSCISAEYTLTDKGYVRVYNACRKGGVDGKPTSITGKAFPVQGSNNAKLKVQFFWPFRADYWIVGLADDYSWALVSNPSRKYLWILSRSKHMDPQLYERLLDKLKAEGYDLSRLRKGIQDCD